MAKKLQPPLVDDRLMWDLWSSYYLMPTLTAAHELGLFSALEEKCLSQQEVESALSLKARPVEGMLSVLTGAGLIVRMDERYGLSETARTYLLPSSPYYWGGFFSQIRDYPISHGSILEAFKKDKPTVSDTDVYEMTAEMESMAVGFTRAMHAVTLAPGQGSAMRGNFQGVKRLLDVGGGSGNFCISLVQNHLDIRCTVLELPAVCKVVDQYIADYGLKDRINSSPGDFFVSQWPRGYDAVFFGNIFHNWDRERCLILGRKAFDCLPPGGRIYLQEMLLDDSGSKPLTVAANTIVMIFNHDGKQFTASELKGLLEECGFRDIECVPTYGYYSLTMGVKPQEC